ncbi:MAG: helix-turn-helix domain-containing protein [candidate division WOR-3 bacterium]|nr:helix-turn-helix domain-containing protein [candidate division WOR-3 bacterium]
MSRRRGRFRMSEELGQRLRDLRERAGLTQAELARLVGNGWDQTLVSRLEAAKYPSPGLGLVADYLQACRASFTDVAVLLDAYTLKPGPVEMKGRQAVNEVSAVLPVKIATQVLKYDAKTTVARRTAGEPPFSPEERMRRVLNLAAAASRRKRLDILVAHLLDEVGSKLDFRERQFVDRFARKVWGALTSTRGLDQRLRVRRMARVLADGIVEHFLPKAEVQLVRERVVELYRAMEQTGGFASMPQPAKSGRKPKPYKEETDPRIAAGLVRQINIGEGLTAVMAEVQTRGWPHDEKRSWYQWLALLASDAYDTQPGSPERERIVAEALKDRPDPEQARRFAELALDGLDRRLKRKGPREEEGETTK